MVSLQAKTRVMLYQGQVLCRFNVCLLALLWEE